ncbi:MAG: hypothetical protein WC101_03585 [Candidatus Gracilibacteria bacterium]
MNREPLLSRALSTTSSKKLALLPGIKSRAAAIALAVLTTAGCNQPGHWIFPDAKGVGSSDSGSSDTSSFDVGTDATSSPDVGADIDVDAFVDVGQVDTSPDSVGISDVATVDAADVVATPDANFGDSSGQDVFVQDLAIGGDVELDAPQSADVLEPIDASTDVTETVSTLSIPWGTVVWDGYGKVSWDPVLGQLNMTPQIATQPKETHSCLVVSNQVYSQPYQFGFTMKTVKQLRENSPPNPWEVGWAVLGYKNNGTDKGKFKYAILKPNGLEIGESLLNDIQNDLFTSVVGATDFPIGVDYDVTIRVENNVMSVKVNGVEVKQYVFSATDILTPDGLVGVYNEDSEVVVSNFKAEQL